MCIVCEGKINSKNNQTLDCSGCKSLTKIPKIIGLISLNCRGCTSLTQIPQISSLQKIDCSGCISLTDIPMPILNKLKYLNCSGCPSLKTIHGLNNVQALDCSGCIGLTRIQDLNSLKNLNCSDCPSLTKISNVKNLEILNCSYCLSLKRIRGINTSILYCSHCPHLIEINIPSIKRLLLSFHCVDCRLLTNIPDIDESITRSLIIKGCPWINLKNNNYQHNIKKLLKIQKWAKKIILYKRLIKMMPMIIQIYYDPECRGGYFHKKNLIEFIDNISDSKKD